MTQPQHVLVNQTILLADWLLEYVPAQVSYSVGRRGVRHEEKQRGCRRRTRRPEQPKPSTAS